MDGRVRVAVRVRPLIEDDVGAVACLDPRTLEVRCPSAGGVEQVKTFSFDVCAHDGFGTDDLFKHCGVPELMNAALKGMKVTVLAYGATGSGKSHTIGGSRGHKGLIDLSAIDLFQHNVKSLKASLYEVYDDNVYDLLDPTRATTTLPVRHDTQKNYFFAAGLVELECLSADDVSAIVDEGKRARRTASHKLNRDSSRGHAVLSLKLADGGKINFVDLAGNERLTRSHSQNATETGAINRSLFALGKVISSLSSDSTEHIPYRDSTLTKLLMDSLGGDVFTLMIATVSPAAGHVDESLCTLQYAHRAKGIQNTPTVHLATKRTPTVEDEELESNPEDDLRSEVAALRREVAELREENRRLRMESELGSSQQSPSPPRRSTTGYSSRWQSTRGSDTDELVEDKIDRLAANFSTLEARVEEAHQRQAQWHHDWQQHSYARPSPKVNRVADSAQQHRRSLANTDSLCAVHRQSTGDVVRRHREGILGI